VWEEWGGYTMELGSKLEQRLNVDALMFLISIPDTFLKKAFHVLVSKRLLEVNRYFYFV
jgi:hypothetical protein